MADAQCVIKMLLKQGFVCPLLIQCSVLVMWGSLAMGLFAALVPLEHTNFQVDLPLVCHAPLVPFPAPKKPLLALYVKGDTTPTQHLALVPSVKMGSVLLLLAAPNAPPVSVTRVPIISPTPNATSAHHLVTAGKT